MLNRIDDGYMRDVSLLRPVNVVLPKPGGAEAFSFTPGSAGTSIDDAIDCSMSYSFSYLQESYPLYYLSTLCLRYTNEMS